MNTGGTDIPVCARDETGEKAGFERGRDVGLVKSKVAHINHGINT